MKPKDFQGQPPPERACAWCDNKRHRGYISVHIMKKRGCIAKNCNYLVPLTTHQFWQDRDKKLNDKKLKKRIVQNEEVIKHGSAEQIAELFEKIIERSFTNERNDNV